MAQLDPLIEALLLHRAESLVLDPDCPAMLTTANGSRPLVKTPIPADRILALVGEIAPAAQRGLVTAATACAFEYRSPHGGVKVAVRPGSRVLIKASVPATAPAVAVAPDPPIAAPPAVPAPVASAGTEAVTMDRLFRELFERRGSDLHLTSDLRPRMRIDGELVELAELPELSAARVERLVAEIVPERNREEFAEHGDTDFAHEVVGLGRIRCNLFRDRRGPGGVFRVIPSKIPTADDLGLSPDIRQLCHLTRGLVLVTGPTGSGKSTTLAAMIDLVNTSRSDHIITIEDPIEFVHPNRRCLINQREIQVHTRGFKTALRAALREDPDVVLVGEMRDLETIAIALETAETGHLVFGTLHTNSAISTIDRLIDQFPADQQSQIRVMLGESLRAVIAQVLCRRIGGGRVAALEVLMVTPAVSNLIREGKTFQVASLMQTGRKYGMILLHDSLLDLVKRKIVEPEEAYRRASDKSSFASALRALNISTDFLETQVRAEPVGA